MDHRLINLLALVPAAGFAYEGRRALRTGISGRGAFAAQRDAKPIRFGIDLAIYAGFFVFSVATALGFLRG